MRSLPPLNNITRKATGIGIVCGLEILVATDCTLTITHGYGFTSRGTLLHFPGGQFKYFRVFENGIKGLLSVDDGIDIWEVLPERLPGSTPITPQVIGSTRFIDNKVVILYLDDPYKNVLRVLLVDKEDLWRYINENNEHDVECILLTDHEPDNIDLFNYDDEFPDGRTLWCATNRNTSLPALSCMDFGFGTSEGECDPEEREFSIESADFQGVFSEYELIIKNGLVELKKGIQALHEEQFYDLIPQQQRHYLDLYFAYLIGPRWNTFRQDEVLKTYIQYFYDLVKDLMATYSELREELCDLMADCCPDERLFPCHLLLGEIQEDIVFGNSVFRHHFRQPPIYNENRKRLQKIRFLHWRMMVLIKNFYIPHVESTEMAEGHYTLIDKNDQVPELTGDDISLDQIRITPSRERHLPLGQQSIPYYYYVAADPSSTHYFWSFDAVCCCSYDQLLSYHGENEDSYTSDCAIKRPLSYQSYPYRYFRIEGAMGQEANAAIDRLEELKFRFNLSFEAQKLNYSQFLADYEGDGDFQIHEDYLGAKHIAGAEQGGHYILLFDENDQDRIKADFWLPHCCFIPPPMPSGSSSSVSASSIASSATLSSATFSKPSDLSFPIEIEEGILKKEKTANIVEPPIVTPLDHPKIVGMGKVSFEFLQSNGFKTMENLAETSVEKLKAIMQKSNKFKSLNVSSWPKQAKDFLATKKKEK